MKFHNVIFLDLKTEVSAYGEGDGITFRAQDLGFFEGARYTLISGNVKQTSEHILLFSLKMREGGQEIVRNVKGIYAGECR